MGNVGQHGNMGLPQKEKKNKEGDKEKEEEEVTILFASSRRGP